MIQDGAPSGQCVGIDTTKQQASEQLRVLLEGNLGMQKDFHGPFILEHVNIFYQGKINKNKNMLRSYKHQ